MPNTAQTKSAQQDTVVSMKTKN